MANILDKAELLTLTDGIAFYATVGGVDYYILQSTLKAPLETHKSDDANPHSVTAAQLNLGNVDDTSDADKPVSTAQAAALALKLDKTDLSTETALGSNATEFDLSNRYKAYFTATYTASTTVTLSNASNLRELFGQITNTNANTLTFAGVTLYFKSGDLPNGMSFASNALTFPADSAVKYNLTGVKINGIFECKIEVR